MLKIVQTAPLMFVLGLSAVYAQSPAPGAPTTAQDDSGIGPWPWVVMVVLLMAALIWNYQRRRGR
ncbi:hypothetical protein [Methylobacterium oxalidis]|uniref:hypothetical protein n=1 Tax=Methylobacterium oxalidis TaxID=944322 RepID=UPI003315405B